MESAGEHPKAQQAPSLAGARQDTFPLLDGLRGLAALAVFVFHGFLIIGWNDVVVWVGRTGEAPVRALSAITTYMGWEAVAVFYVMSAFLLYRPFVLARASTGNPVATSGFALRRAARILPAYWLGLIVLGLLGRGSHVFTLAGIRDYFLFGQIYSGRGTTWHNPVEPAWTICVEVTFYVFLPVWAWAAGRVVRRTGNPWRSEALMLAGLIVFSVAWKVLALRGTTIKEAHQPLLLTLPGSIDVFAAGMLVALFSVPAAREAGGAALERFAERRRLAPGLAAAVFLAMCWLVADGGPLSGNWKAAVLAVSVMKIPVAALLLMTSAVSTAAGGFTRRLLGLGFACWVGVVSYGFYIWHVALFRWADSWLGQGSVSLLGLPLAILGVMAAALSIASASWRFVERPILRRVHRLLRQS